jgi:hypothetical protein
MTHPGNGCHVAQWSEKDRGALVVTGPAGEVVESLRIEEPPGGRPGAGILWHTGWMAFPGTEWQEEPPGQWSRAVFPDTEMGSKR